MVDCIDLVEYVSPEQSFCLNEAKDHTYRGCLLAEQRIDPKAFLQSDCDEATLPDPTATVAVLTLRGRPLAGAADPCGLLAECAGDGAADPGSWRQRRSHPRRSGPTREAPHIFFKLQGETAVSLLYAGPSKLKIFANKESLDFDSAKSEKPTQELTLRPDDVSAGNRFNLLTARYKNVYALTILVPLLKSLTVCRG